MACNPFKQNHKRFIADSLFGAYGNMDNNHLFLSIGRANPWNLPAEQNEDLTPPPTAMDTFMSDTDFWRGVYAHQRIDREDVSLVVRRYDWSIGEVYDYYSDSEDMFDDIVPKRFYVLVDEERVYKCIDNAGAGPSLVAPIHTDAEIRKLSDGYRWKFLYQIPESKRKFLTKTKGNSIGYMPVEFVDYPRRSNDDRFLQWNVQQAAVNGEIAHIRLNPEIKPFLRPDRCVFSNNNNVVVSQVGVGATGVTLSSPYLSSVVDWYNNMVLSIDSSAGQGQRRRIVKYARPSSDQAYVVLDKPISIPLSAGSNPSRFSIVPNIEIDGDGSSNYTEYNPYAKTAEAAVRFSSNEEPARDAVVTDFEMVDPGKNYTFASVRVVAGLTADSTRVPGGTIENVGVAVMSPPGGHGSNPVIELGCSSLMIVKEFDRTEGDKVSTENDYRQVGIILNPYLTKPQYRLSFFQVGSSSLFVPGTTASVSGSPVYGTVVSWYGGATGQIGSSELVLSDVKNGGLTTGNVINGLTVFSVDERKVAGSDARNLVRLRIDPVPPALYFDGQNGQMDAVANQFKRGLYVQGIGNYSNSISASRAVGKLYAWIPAFGTNSYGFLHVENLNGNLKVGEAVNQFGGYTGTFTFGPSGGAIVTEIGNLTLGVTGVYDQTTRLLVSSDPIVPFTNNSFSDDQYVGFFNGETSSGNGYVMSWERGFGGITGSLILSGTQGKFSSGMTFDYGSTRSPASGTVSSVVREGDFVYRSGDILYIQNMNPIRRNRNQKEEIKIVIEF